MSLIDYEREPDFFIAIDGDRRFGRLDADMVFPCCACKCNYREEDQIPCAICAHNSTSRNATCEDISLWMGLKSTMCNDGRRNK